MISQPEITTFIQTYGALILATYAIVQVWAVAIGKKFIWKGKVTIFETGGIEIGFGHGVLLTLTGTFKAERKDIFIQEVKASIVREHDDTEFGLSWLAFKAPQIKINDPTATTLEVPSGINVRLDQPVRYSIVFCDKPLQNRISRKLHTIYGEWNAFLSKNKENILREVRNKRSQGEIEEDYFSKFLEKSQITVDYLDFHKSLNWLVPGFYRVKMEVKTSDPNKSFFEEWSFFLDEELSVKFQDNSIATLKEICLAKREYFIATLDYLSPNEIKK